MEFFKDIKDFVVLGIVGLGAYWLISNWKTLEANVKTVTDVFYEPISGKYTDPIGAYTGKVELEYYGPTGPQYRVRAGSTWYPLADKAQLQDFFNRYHGQIGSFLNQYVTVEQWIQAALVNGDAVGLRVNY